MKVLELFSGTASFSNVAKEKGHETFTIDNDIRFKPDLCIDINDLTSEKILSIFGRPDIIWASPPCQKFSILRVSKNWEKIEKDNYKPKNKETEEAISLIKHTIKLIEELKPKYFFIENPRAMLRKQEFMPNNLRKTITYCKYGMPYQKATDIWTNCNSWTPRSICNANDPCHIRSPRGSRTGIQGIKNNPIHENIALVYNWDGSGSVIRGIIPKELCQEILEAIENEQKT